MQKIKFLLSTAATLVLFSVSAEDVSINCSVADKTISTEDSQPDKADVLLLEKVRAQHGLLVDAAIKLVTRTDDCNDDELAGEHELKKHGTEALPVCDDVGCINSYPSTANVITIYSCHERVKSTIKQQRLPDGRYQTIKVEQKSVARCG